MLLIGFGAKARQGKDSAANAIKRYFEDKTSQWNEAFNDGKQVRVGIFKYATALYQEVNSWLEQTKDFGVPGQLYFVTENKKVYPIPEWVQADTNPEVTELAPYGKHPKLLQWWGTDFRRSQDPDYWVKKLFASIPANLDIAMVTDVRFPNEADAIKQRGGYLVNVQRLRTDGTPYLATDRPSDHPSELALDGYNWGYFLKVKDGDQALLAEQAITLAEYLRGLQK